MLVTVHFRFAIFVAAALPSLFCAVAPAQATDTWSSIRSKIFSIIGNATPQQMRAAAERLEQFRRAFSRLYPQLKLGNGKPTEIVMFRDATAYFDFLPRRPDGSADVGVAGYFQAGEDTNYITFAASQRQEDPYSTAIHEFVHSVIDANFDRSQLSPWLSEGLAEYLETVRVDGNKIIIGEAQIDHLRLLRRVGTIPLAQFLALKPADLKTISPDRRRVFYAQAWAVVHLLMRQKAVSLESLTTQQIQTSGDLEIALKKLVDGDVGKAETVAVDSSISIPEPMAIADVPQSIGSARLGDLLFHTGELARSETFLRNALGADANEPLANASLGLLLLKQEKTADARPLLEKAVAAGSTNYLVLTGYAFSLIEPLAKNGTEISDAMAAEIRSLLRRASALEPKHIESYRLTALLNYLRDEDPDGAITLLQKALSIKQGDADSELLLARILLRREDITRAREIAEQIVSSTNDARRKAEASEIIKAAYEYTRAKSAAERPLRMDITLGERQNLVILKRSWLTEADVARIDEERVNNNFNRIILRPTVGETQLVGRIEKIACSGGKITYSVLPKNDGLTTLTGDDFSSVRMTVAREGDSTFQIGCDISLANELAVINYRPPLLPAGDKSAGQLTAISFVPENFRFKTLTEMNAARLVAIDDDTARRSGPSVAVNPETMHRSIAQSLRRMQKGEQRVNGVIEKIDCSAGRIVFNVSSDRKIFRLIQSTDGRPDIGWFTVASSQLPVACGSGPLISTTLITFLPSTPSDGFDGVIRAIEFVPDGFIP